MAANNSAAMVAGRSNSSSVAAMAYQSSAASSTNFAMTVKGDLDSGELDALNSLLEEVSALSDEFFNGDFDKAFAMAMDFEMDASEFSAMSLDIARSTSASMVESYTAVEGYGAPESAAVMQANNGLATMVGQLLEMMDMSASFSQPKLLLTDLLANQMAQNSFR